MSNNINLINFTDLNLEEKKMVLSWRSHPSVKKWMYSSDEISLENHLNFIESLKDSVDMLYFLVQQDNNYIGVIDFTDIDKNSETAEFGLYAKIGLKGVGKILLNAICNYGFNTLKVNKLIAEAFIENDRAITLYKKFHFKEIVKKKVKNKEVIYMELKNEDR